MLHFKYLILFLWMSWCVCMYKCVCMYVCVSTNSYQQHLKQKYQTNILHWNDLYEIQLNWFCSMHCNVFLASFVSHWPSILMKFICALRLFYINMCSRFFVSSLIFIFLIWAPLDFLSFFFSWFWFNNNT